MQLVTAQDTNMTHYRYPKKPQWRIENSEQGICSEMLLNIRGGSHLLSNLKRKARGREMMTKLPSQSLLSEVKARVTLMAVWWGRVWVPKEDHIGWWWCGSICVYSSSEFHVSEVFHSHYQKTPGTFYMPGNVLRCSNIAVNTIKLLC